jgi:hypothetical protein
MVNRTLIRVGEELVITKPESAGKPFDISKRDVWEPTRRSKVIRAHQEWTSKP